MNKQKIKEYQIQIIMKNGKYEEWYLKDQFKELTEENRMLFKDEVEYQKRTKNDITAQHCSVVLVEATVEQVADDEWEEIDFNIIEEIVIK